MTCRSIVTSEALGKKKESTNFASQSNTFTCHRCVLSALCVSFNVSTASKSFHIYGNRSSASRPQANRKRHGKPLEESKAELGFQNAMKNYYIDFLSYTFIGWLVNERQGSSMNFLYISLRFFLHP